ncbi:aldolase [Vreelandella sulfidaeris]|uniref:Aldolase n=1 Tax=Vreelandella sulfidaeris TaxID=115553 RepID=A0A365TKE2_9GAMM|nr:aldolase/citrate lyase family protein [Halomonas sulfidaeris]RBI66247.1 aldolase [Halomonas sulfidaeris]
MNQLNFMMITASPDVASFIEQHGVSRIFMDQEVNGKAERQGHLDTHKAAHSLEEIAGVASVIRHAELMVRLNPLHSFSDKEVAGAINSGAQRLMLPMFTKRDEVEEFLALVNGQVPVTFLAETPQALVRMPDWLPLLKPGYDEVHIGLNDLSLAMGLSFLFEPLAIRLLDTAAELLNGQEVKWGVGGMARIGQGELPAEILMGEHIRLGSQWVILSRAFHQGAASSAALMSQLDFPDEITKLREAQARWQQASHMELMKNHQKIATIALQIGRSIDA